jgi:hypothetical protein
MRRLFGKNQFGFTLLSGGGIRSDSQIAPAAWTSDTLIADAIMKPNAPAVTRLIEE